MSLVSTLRGALDKHPQLASPKLSRKGRSDRGDWNCVR